MIKIKDKKVLFIVSMVFLLILTTGLSYAYFSTAVSGNENAKNTVVETGTLRLTYTDSPEIVAEHIKPGWTTTKVVTVKNTGTLDTAYNLVWQELTNEITNNELVISAGCERLNNSNAIEGTCENIDETAVINSNIKKNISIESGITHKYTLTITFKEMNKVQDYNQNKKFNGVIGITEYKVPIVNCTFDGDLKTGAEYVNGQYTYRYKQMGWYTNSGITWSNQSADGWGVQLTDKTSTEPVTSEVCTYINDKPIIYMSHMFRNSGSTSIDLSSFNISNVIDMQYMFDGSKVTSFDLSNFDTSKVTNMTYMFSNTSFETVDLSNLDTSNVTNMYAMFSGSKLTTLDLSSFNTSKVTNMGFMFSNTKLIKLDLSSFDTSNVTTMNSMFYSSLITDLDLSNFNTSNVTTMNSMFRITKLLSFDISNFDTSKVTDMESMFDSSVLTTIDLSNFDVSSLKNANSMFARCAATTIDLSSFNTSGVTNMGKMFLNATNLVTIYASDKFVTDSLVTWNSIFSGCTKLVGGAGTKYSSANVSKEYAKIDGGTSSPGYFTLKSA